MVKDGVTLNVLIYPGTIFGEIGSILGRPRTSSVKARTCSSIILLTFLRSKVSLADFPFPPCDAVLLDDGLYTMALRKSAANDFD